VRADAIQIDHIFATAGAAKQGPAPDTTLVVDSIVNKTPLGGYTTTGSAQSLQAMLAHFVCDVGCPPLPFPCN